MMFGESTRMPNILKPLNKTFWQSTLIIFFCFMIYVVLFFIIGKNLFSSSNYPYYNYLIKAFTDGKLSLDSPMTYDLSLFKGQYYMYWGPAPALFILPFY